MGTLFRERAAKKEAASKALTTWYADAGVIADLFAEAGMPIPEDVAHVLNIDGAEATEVPLKSVPAPFQRPSHIPPHWLSIATSSAMPITLVQAVMHGEHEPMRVRDVIARVRALMPERMIEESQVYTIGTRLKTHEKLDYITGLSWRLRDPDGGPREIGGRIWGQREAFTLAEIAIMRREAVVEILRVGGSLTRTQVLAILKASDWAEFSQPLLTKDLETLQEKHVAKKNPMNGKWELLPAAEKKDAPAPPLARVHRIGASVGRTRMITLED